MGVSSLKGGRRFCVSHEWYQNEKRLGRTRLTSPDIRVTTRGQLLTLLRGDVIIWSREYGINCNRIFFFFFLYIEDIHQGFLLNYSIIPSISVLFIRDLDAVTVKRSLLLLLKEGILKPKNDNSV